MVLHYRSSLWKRVQQKRCGNSKRNSTDNMPNVVVVCSSSVPPFLIAKNHNCTTLRKCHSTLLSVLPSPLGTKIPSHKKIYPGEDYFEVGHCAEFHAVQKLLTKYDRKCKKTNSLLIKDIQFSCAIKIPTGLPRAYCGTCKQTFIQLK